jgi:hypothetical protein
MAAAAMRAAIQCAKGVASGGRITVDQVGLDDLAKRIRKTGEKMTKAPAASSDGDGDATSGDSTLAKPQSWSAPSLRGSENGFSSMRAELFRSRDVRTRDVRTGYVRTVRASSENAPAFVQAGMTAITSAPAASPACVPACAGACRGGARFPKC